MIQEQLIWVISHNVDDVSWGPLESPRAYGVKEDAERDLERLTLELARQGKAGWYSLEEIFLKY